MHDIQKRFLKCKSRQSKIATNGNSNFIHLYKYINIIRCHMVQDWMTLWHCANTAQHNHADSHLLKADICPTDAILLSTTLLQHHPLSCLYHHLRHA